MIATRDDLQNSGGLEEIFRNRAVTELALGPFAAIVFQLLLGLIFAALLAISLVYCVLALFYVLLGVDPFSIEYAFQDVPKGIEGPIALVAGMLFTVLFFGTMAYCLLRCVGRNFYARAYVRSGKPLDFVEGKISVVEGSEIPVLGVEVGGFYFRLDDCWFNIDTLALTKYGAVDGTARAWYIPATGRKRENPSTGRTV